MIAVIKPNTPEEKIEHLIGWIKEQNVDVHVSKGHEYTVLGLIGNTSNIDMDLLGCLDIVESVKRITEQ